jgi:poly(A) polymerase
MRRINRDPVRALRAIRHAARNNFTIETETWKAICTNSDKLSLCPPSRLRDEFLRDLYGGSIGPWFELAQQAGIFVTLFPLYRKLLSLDAEAAASTRKHLAGIFRTIDEAHRLAVASQGHRQPDHFLFALILTPWVEQHWHLYSEFRKNATLFQLARQVRDEIDRTIGIDLNLRRSLRQETVNFLLNLAVFIHNKSQAGWPKWLKRKCYYRHGKLFYEFYRASSQGDRLSEEQLLSSPSVVPEMPSPVDASPLPTHPAPSQTKPAFSTRRGGVFGFKK